jgi:hypothetical protein
MLLIEIKRKSKISCKCTFNGVKGFFMKHVLQKFCETEKLASLLFEAGFAKQPNKISFENKDMKGQALKESCPMNILFNTYFQYTEKITGPSLSFPTVRRWFFFIYSNI